MGRVFNNSIELKTEVVIKDKHANGHGKENEDGKSNGKEEVKPEDDDQFDENGLPNQPPIDHDYSEEVIQRNVVSVIKYQIRT